MSDTVGQHDSLHLALDFTAEELAANRRGELSSGQYPPLYWKALGLCLLGLVIVLCVRWVLRNRSDRATYFVAAAAVVSLVLAGFIARGVADGLRDRIEARACSYTNVLSGIGNSRWGFGLYDVEVGPRLFWSRRRLEGAGGAVKYGTAYTAYYACHSGSLASLELAAPGWELPGTTEHLKDLGELFDFALSDLDSNRAGDVNFGQLPFGRVAGVLFFASLFATPGLACVLELRKKRSLPLFGLCLVLWLIAGGVLYGARGLFQDLAEQRSCSLAGTLTDVSLRFGKTTASWRLTIGEKLVEFQHPNRGKSLLRIGSGYRAHYLCHSQHLVSIEPLS